MNDEPEVGSEGGQPLEGDGAKPSHSGNTLTQALRKVSLPDPLLLELREYSRIAEELTRERTRLGHRMRAQLWRYYPQLLRERPAFINYNQCPS